MATKIALLARRHSTLVLILSALAAIAGAYHGCHHPGMWDGPL